MPDIYLSYSRKDKDFAKRLHEALVRSGREVWVDWLDIPIAAEWMPLIQEAIINSHIFLFVISPDSVASKVCEAEREHAMKFDKRIVPVLYRDLDSGQNAPPEIRAINWHRFQEADDFDTAFAKLETALAFDQEYLNDHTRLLARATEWTKKGRHRDYLLRGVALVEAQYWLSLGHEHDPKPTELHEDFIRTSHQESMRLNERIRRNTGRIGRMLGLTPNRKIFISYRRADSQVFADRIYDRLAKDFPPNSVFYDLFSIELGVDFANVIRQTLSDCAVVLVVIGRQWTTVANPETGEKRLFDVNDFVRLEVETALNHPEVRVIPLLVDGATMPTYAEIPASLKRLVQINGTVIRPGRDFHEDMNVVVKQVRKAQRSIAVDKMQYDS